MAQEEKKVNKKKKTVDDFDISPQEMIRVIEDGIKLHVRFDTLRSRFTVRDRAGKTTPMTDGHMHLIYNFCRVNAPVLGFNAYKSKSAIDDAIGELRLTRAYNPLEDYLSECLTKYRQEPKDYLQEMFSHFSLAEDMQYKLAERWLYGVIGRVKFNFQNAMLVLNGKQDVGKSFFFAQLMRNADDFYIDDEINFFDRDQVLYFGTKLIWVIEEFGAVLKTSERNKVKGFLTKQKVEKRAAYARFSVTHERVCSLAGTTNDESVFTDLTGNKRYLMADVLNVDFDWFENHFDPDLLWGQLVDKVAREGVACCKLSKEEFDYKNELNASRMVEDLSKEEMQNWFVADPEGRVISSDIKRKLEIADVKINSFQFGDYMRAFGGEKKIFKIKGKSHRGYSGLSWDPAEAPPTKEELLDKPRYFKGG